MKQFLFVVVSIFSQLLWVSNVYAFSFGAQEKIECVADTKIPVSNDEKICLARKLTIHHFIGPYSIRDDGFVLGVTDKDQNNYKIGKYYPLPDEKLKTLQAAGYLPTPLPTWELSTADKLYGNLLWIIIGLFIVFYSIKKLLLVGYYGIKKLLKNN